MLAHNSFIMRYATAVLLALIVAYMPTTTFSQGYVSFSGPSLMSVDHALPYGKREGRNFGLWLEAVAEGEIYMVLGTDAVFPALNGIAMSNSDVKKGQGLFTSGYPSADASLFTWRQGMAYEMEAGDLDFLLLSAFSTDWRHVARPTQDISENFFSMGWMFGAYAEGDELNSWDFLPSELRAGIKDELGLAFKAGYEFVLTEKKSRNVWAELTLGIPLKDEIGVSISPTFATRKLLVYDAAAADNVHKRLNSWGLKIGFYAYID